MKNFIRRFWGVFLSIAAVVGLYFGALDVDKVGWFWATFLAALTLVALSLITGRAWKATTDTILRIRNYPIVLHRVAELEDERKEIFEKILTIDSHKIWTRGFIEGQLSIVGTQLAEGFTDLTLVSAKSDGKSVYLVADCLTRTPPTFARFELVNTMAGNREGILQVINFDSIEKRIVLRCVEPTVLGFWQHLLEKATYDYSPPMGVKLVPYKFDPKPIADGEFDYSIPPPSAKEDTSG
jgi:hypothetical protein